MPTSRQIVNDIFNRKNSSAGALWTGHPNDATIPLYAKEWGIEATREAIYTHLNDDCRWFISGHEYRHPEGLPVFDHSWNGFSKKNTLSSAGCFSEVEDVSEVEKYPWPDAKYMDFTQTYAEIDKHQDKMVFAGMWSCFFHNICDFLGMENYFVMMYENPAVVDRKSVV